LLRASTSTVVQTVTYSITVVWPASKPTFIGGGGAVVSGAATDEDGLEDVARVVGLGVDDVDEGDGVGVDDELGAGAGVETAAAATMSSSPLDDELGAAEDEVDDGAALLVVGAGGGAALDAPMTPLESSDDELDPEAEEAQR